VLQTVDFVDEQAAQERLVKQMNSDGPPEQLHVPVLRSRLTAVGVDTKGLLKQQLVALYKTTFNK